MLAFRFVGAVMIARREGPMTERDQDVAWPVIAGVALAILAMHLAQSFAMPPYMADPGNGTPWAPHSDALGPWLDGGLAYLFGLPPSHFLYRPTLGVFWGSLLAATGRIEAFPSFFALWLLAFCAAFTLSRSDRALRNAFVLMLGFGAMHFPDAWRHVGFDVDLAALALTLSGVMLVLHDRGKYPGAALVAGCACLGVAAAIRGPLMLAGPLMIAVRLVLMGPVRAPTMIAAVGLFLAPIAIDFALQRHNDAANNGLWALLCVYSDPSHGWTPACKARYLQHTPAAAEILRGFLTFRLSGEGIGDLAGQLSQRAAEDLRLFNVPGSHALILGMAALASGYPGTRPAPITPFVKAIAIVATLALAGTAGAGALLAWILVATAVAALARHWHAFLCLAGYLCGAIFLAALGLASFDRLAHTFEFTLVLGIGLLAMMPARGTDEAGIGPAISQPALAAAIGLALSFLYCGNLVLGSDMRNVYLRDVYRHHNAAMKIGDDPAIDRSLYYTADRRLVYTRHDDLALGAVRTYRALATDASFNASFMRPNAFQD